MLFKFKDFEITEERQLEISALVGPDLKEVREFFDDVEALSVSRLGLKGKGIREYQSRLAVLKSNPWTSVTTYRNFVKDIAYDFQIARQFEGRKVVLEKLLDNSPDGIWHRIEALMQHKSGKVHFAVLKARIMGQGEFMLYPATALIELGEGYLPEVRRLKRILSKIQEKVNWLKHNEKISEEVHVLAQAYLHRIMQRFNDFSNSLIRSLLARLETANKHVDIQDADNLVEDVRELKGLLTHHHLTDPIFADLSIPTRLGQQLQLEDFNSIHRILEAHGGMDIKERLGLMGWRCSNHDFGLLQTTQAALIAVPRLLHSFVFPRPNWFQRLLPANQYRYDFPVRYGLVLAKLKQLSKYKRRAPVNPYDLSKDSNLAELRHLQNEIEGAYRNVESEKDYGFMAHLFSRQKNSLIGLFQDFLKRKMTIVVRKKIEILRDHKDRIKAFRDFRLASSMAASGLDVEVVYSHYLSEPLEGQLLALCAEINENLWYVPSRENEGLRSEFQGLQAYITEFYTTRERLSSPTSSTFFIEEFSKKNFLALLGSDKALLTRQLDQFVEQINHIVLRGDPAEQAIATKSVCILVKKYITYFETLIITGVEESPDLSTNLDIFERLTFLLVAELSYVTDAIANLSALRMQERTSANKVRIRCVAREFNSVVDPLVAEGEFGLGPEDVLITPLSSLSISGARCSLFNEGKPENPVSSESAAASVRCEF